MKANQIMINRKKHDTEMEIQKLKETLENFDMYVSLMKKAKYIETYATTKLEELNKKDKIVKRVIFLDDVRDDNNIILWKVNKVYDITNEDDEIYDVTSEVKDNSFVVNKADEGILFEIAE